MRARLPLGIIAPRCRRQQPSSSRRFTHRWPIRRARTSPHTALPPQRSVSMTTLWGGKVTASPSLESVAPLNAVGLTASGEPKSLWD